MTDINKTAGNPDDPPRIDGEGLAVINNLKDLKQYWYICINTKGLPNSLKYSDMEEISRNLLNCYGYLYRANKRGAINVSRKKKGLPALYRPYDILQDARAAESEFTLAEGKMELVVEHPALKTRKSELDKRRGAVARTMRGWLIYLQSQSR
ncbi:MAG: hypothetical protein ACI3ZF_00690 [Candidatus Cryptobacteroides sp.]